MKQKELDLIVANQKRSLDRWIDYLVSEEADYPLWAKYWAFSSIIKMGKFEKSRNQEAEKTVAKGRFQKRTKTTTSSFPLLNARALAKTISAMAALIKEKPKARQRAGIEKQKPKEQRDPAKAGLQVVNESKQLDDQAFLKLLSTEKFADLYTQFLIEIPEYSTAGLQEIRGEWKKFVQGSSPDELVKSLAGYPLEWCTADLDTARA